MKETPIDKVIESLHVPAPRLWGQVQAHIDDLRAIAADLQGECRELFQSLVDAGTPTDPTGEDQPCYQCHRSDTVLWFSNQNGSYCADCCAGMLRAIDAAGQRVSGKLDEGEIDLRDAYESLYDVCTGEANIWLPLRKPGDPVPIILTSSPGVGKSEIIGGDE